MTALFEEALAVRTLAAELQGEDLELSIESETTFVEAAEAVLSSIRDAETMAAAARTRAEDIISRALSCDRRAERLRDVLMSAMLTAGQKSLRLPEATLSVSEPAPTAVVTDEALIPAVYKITKITERVAMREITERLRAGETIPGATLRNGPPRLTVRTK